MTKNIQTIVASIAVITLLTGLHFTSQRGESESIASNSIEFNQQSEASADSVPIFSLRDFNNAIVDIAERMNPTVVTITTRQTVRERQRSPFSYFFNDPRYDQEREFERNGLGSGVIVSNDGYILTNNHVIAQADEISIRLYSGEELEATVVGTDPASDIAVLKIDGSEELPAAPLGDSESLNVGELVLAIGSPLDQRFAHTVSMGIVSAKGRTGLELSAYENYIQTDAAINPGNSGGALINMDGELVGINTAIASRSGGNQGIGFAIPVNMARTIMESLITEGRVVRGYIGIRGSAVNEVMARALGLEADRGIIIGEVVPESAADRAGLQEGDVILEKNGEPIRDWTRFATEVAGNAPGTELEFLIFRDGDRQSVTVTLDEYPDPESVASMNPDEAESLEEELGFRVENLTDNIRRQLQLDSSVEGAVVADIQQNSPAYRQGLRSGDVITQIQNQPVRTGEEFYAGVRELRSSGQEAALLRVNRRGQLMFIAFELP